MRYPPISKSALLAGLAAALGAGVTFGYDYTEEAPVVSSTPIVERINTPSQHCWNETVTTQEYRDADRGYGGAILGGIVGGVKLARTELQRTNGGRDPGALARYRSAAGETFLRQGKAREAERQFKSALRLDKDHPAALLRLGDICYDRNHKERAVVLWKGLARTHPNLAHLVLERLEAAYFERGRMSEMALAYEELLARTPQDARLHLALARMHVKKGELPEAAGVLTQALVIDPGSLPARLLLVNVHRRLGDVSRALDQVEGLLRDVPEGERFTCAACGAGSEEYWTRCPQCLAWSAA